MIWGPVTWRSFLRDWRFNTWAWIRTWSRDALRSEVNSVAMVPEIHSKASRGEKSVFSQTVITLKRSCALLKMNVQITTSETRKNGWKSYSCLSWLILRGSSLIFEVSCYLNACSSSKLFQLNFQDLLPTFMTKNCEKMNDLQWKAKKLQPQSGYFWNAPRIFWLVLEETKSFFSWRKIL